MVIATLSTLTLHPAVGQVQGGDALWVSRYDAANERDWALAIAVSSDGTLVYVTGGSELDSELMDYATVAYNTQDGRALWEARYNGPANSIDIATDLAVSPDGSRVYVTGRSAGRGSGPDYATVAYAASDGGQVWVARYSDNYWDGAESISVSPDGSIIYVTGMSGAYLGASSSDFITVAYDAVDGRQLWIGRYDGSGREDRAVAAVPSPDSARVFVTGSSEGIDSYDDYATLAYSRTGDLLWEARYNSGYSDRPKALVAAPDGSRLFVTGGGTGPGPLQFYATVAYSADSGEELWVAEHEGVGATDMSISPDGRRLFVTGEADDHFETVAYNALGGEELWVARYDGPQGDDHPYAAAVARDGSEVIVTGVTGRSLAASSNDYATVAYDAFDGDELWVARYNGPGSGNDSPRGIVVGPDGSKVFVTGFSAGDGSGSDYATIAYCARTGVACIGVANPSPQVHIALGDSYSSGEGAPGPSGYDPGTDRDPVVIPSPIPSPYGPPLELEPGNKCHRSEMAYPRRLGPIRPVHVACSGARIANIFESGQYGEPPQSAWLHVPGASLITLTIGGNDAGFDDVLIDCNLHPHCDTEDAKVRDRILGLRTPLSQLFRQLVDEVQTTSTMANVFVLGYPLIVPIGEPWELCGGIDLNERIWLRDIGDLLNIVIENSIYSAGRPQLHFVNVVDAFQGHEACTSEAWVNGPSWPLAASFHPNPTGHERLKFCLQGAMAAGQQTWHCPSP